MSGLNSAAMHSCVLTHSPARCSHQPSGTPLGSRPSSPGQRSQLSRTYSLKQSTAAKLKTLQVRAAATCQLHYAYLPYHQPMQQFQHLHFTRFMPPYDAAP